MSFRRACLVAILLGACASGTGDEDAAGGGLDAGGLDGGSSGADAGTDAGRDGGRPPDDAGTSGRVCEADDVCDNGLDDDCDGRVDDGCPCAPGAVSACFRGDPRHRAIGLCRDGTMLCVGTGVEFGEWGDCTGDVLEADEVCETAALDEDCDGAGNDGCECVDGSPDLPCGTETGACEAGLQRCMGGRRGECEGYTGPEIEQCNAIDDDCDGAIDEAITRACGIDVGVCRPGVERCTDGAFGACEGGESASDERCDGLDNDCDASTDESVSRTCGSDVGRCVAGTETCAGGTFGACEGRVDAIDEGCNDVDDDCDGTVDEELVRACGSDVGACVAGTETCAAGVWGACAGSTGPRAEACDGATDENCDGSVDEGCVCTVGAMRSCGTDVGRCTTGTQTCGTSGWGACTGGVDPRTETCDGTDDNCDGTVDEGCNCVTGTTRPCGIDTGECQRGTETCNAVGNWGPCAGSIDPVPEVCNMRDDDCDGAIDDGGVCPRFPPVVMCPGGTSTTVGTAVMFTASGSDPDGGAVTFTWSVAAAPAGSRARTMPSDAATTSFTPDVAGNYTLRFCATDDEGESACCTVNVVAMSSCTPPATPVLTACGTSWDRRPIVEFAPLASGVTLTLFEGVSASPYATITMDGQNYHRPSVELGTGGPPPGTEISIFARACLDSDGSCCSVGAPVRVRLIEACSTPIAPSATNVLFSEYVINGDGACPSTDCEAGEAIEITNLSHCPVSLANHHFSYQNASGAAFRWMDFTSADVIPPRGVYVAIRNRAASMCSYPFFGPDDPSLFGLLISRLAMQGMSLSSGWFNNTGGGMSTLRIATGAWMGSLSSGATIAIISPYRTTNSTDCEGVGFDAIDRCGDIAGGSTPTQALFPNQLGRLWHPCDAVVSPVPASCR